jgi:hypothetical protein
MCQLTFTNLHDSYLNRLYVLNQAFANTLTEHKDGFGFFNPPNNSRKTYVAPINCLNIGTFIKKINNQPVISHVRKASFGQKEITDEKAHPFYSDNFVLAHNGTLELKLSSEYKITDFKDKIDTEVFLSVLDDIYVKNGGDVIKAITDAYSNFTGKFAFLLYEFKKKSFYIIKGETASLYKVDITLNKERVGFVVNTQKDSLITGLIFFNNQASLKNIIFDWVEDNIKPLEDEKIYKFNEETDDLDIVGEIKEEKKVTVVSQPTRATSTMSGNIVGGYTQQKITIENETIKRFFDECSRLDVTIRFMDELIYKAVGKPLLGCNENDIKFFLDTVLPYLISNISSKHVIKEWKKIKVKDISELSFHQDCDLEFPYFLETDISKLRKRRQLQ